jgi:hypothetical protein
MVSEAGALSVVSAFGNTLCTMLQVSNVSENCAVFIFTRGERDGSSYTDLALRSMSQKERDYYEDLDVGGKILLELI